MGKSLTQKDYWKREDWFKTFPMYKLFGLEISPFTLKIKSYLNYKKIKYKWIKNPNSKELRKLKQTSSLPFLLTDDGEVLQDSTNAIVKLEHRHSKNSIYPEDSRLIFISSLIEEYSDEWMIKHLFNYRWTYEVDQNLASKRIAASSIPFYLRYLPIISELALEQTAQYMKDKYSNMASSAYGVDATNRELVETSFKRLIDLLENHLIKFPYLFGGRPSIADFGLWGQLYGSWMDITARNFINQRPNLVKWLKKMENPKIEGDFLGWSDVHLTIELILEKEIANVFLPWSNANYNALNDKKDTFSVSLEGKSFKQNTQKSHAKSLKELRLKYNEYDLKESIKPILNNSGCLKFLD